jgi:mRNA interferase MazF
MARGDVLLVTLPASDGREQQGRRPAIAIQADMAGEPMLVIAPVTSNLKAMRFAFTVRIEPSSQNGLTAPSIVMVFQLRAIDKSRIVRKIGQLSQADMARVDETIWQMLKPPGSTSADLET